MHWLGGHSWDLIYRVNLCENDTAVARVHFEYDPKGKMEVAFIYSQDADTNLSESPYFGKFMMDHH